MIDNGAPPGGPDPGENIPSNPFLLPRMELNPLQPLVPWKVPEHEDYFVPVDHTHIAYDEFKAAVNHDARTLHDHGRLVVVLGNTGCGKTSLLARCIGWMQDELPSVGVTSYVLECNRLPVQRKPLDLSQRLKAVCHSVIHQAQMALGLDSTFVDELPKNESSPAGLYDYLGHVLATISPRVNAALIILLPDTDLSEEIVAYAQMVRARIVFCLESTAVGRPIPWPDQMLEHAAAPPIELHVGPLDPGDVFLFTDKRLAMHDLRKDDSNAGAPRVGQDVMSELSRSPAAATIAGLVRIMHGIYHYKLSQPPPYTQITMQDAIRYLLAAYANRIDP